MEKPARPNTAQISLLVKGLKQNTVDPRTGLENLLREAHRAVLYIQWLEGENEILRSHATQQELGLEDT